MQEEHCTFDVHKDQCYLGAGFESHSMQESQLAALPCLISVLALECSLTLSGLIPSLANHVLVEEDFP